MAHSCEALENLPKGLMGNYVLFCYGNKYTDGQDLNLNINTEFKEIFIERTHIKNKGIHVERKCIPINFCPFCGAFLHDDDPTLTD